MNVKEQIESLRKELHKHNYNYYVLDNPTVSDYEFDLKLKDLKKLEDLHPEFYDSNSPTVRVGGDITKNFETIVHNSPMYSLDNSYSIEDLYAWEKRIKKIIEGNIEYTCELKYDGASISLSYVDGKFMKAITRGDGVQGDDVTANIKTIPTVPLILQGDFIKNFDIRGEIVMPIDGFKKLNSQRVSNGEEPFKNPRNTASGSLKMQDSKEVSKRPLECLLYSIVESTGIIKSQYESLEIAKKWGFNVSNEIKLAKSIEEVFELSPNLPDVVQMQTRSPNLQGEGEIPLRRLIKESLRMRPTRIIVGEVREAEALDLLIALNSGLPGMGTLHANSPRDAIVKLQTLPLLAGENISHKFIAPTVASAIDVIVHTTLDAHGNRRISEVSSVTGRYENDHAEIEMLWKWDGNQYQRGVGSLPNPERFTAIGAPLSQWWHK